MKKKPCSSKDTAKKIKREATHLEKMFTKYTKNSLNSTGRK
jgi:hypothetical protein